MAERPGKWIRTKSYWGMTPSVVEWYSRSRLGTRGAEAGTGTSEGGVGAGTGTEIVRDGTEDMATVGETSGDEDQDLDPVKGTRERGGGRDQEVEITEDTSGTAETPTEGEAIPLIVTTLDMTATTEMTITIGEDEIGTSMKFLEPWINTLWSLTQDLQLIVPSTSFTQIRHGHDLDHEAGPTGEVLRPLAFTCLGIILFPSEASPLPLREHVLHDVLTELGIDLSGTLLMRTLNPRNILRVSD
jgi:hypothetical protein